jgi:lipoprotein-releasing system permease protein
MKLALKIALKYLFSFRSKALSFMSIISILGVIVGVSALLITLSVMNGFSYGIKKKLLENSPHIVIFKATETFENYKELEKILREFKDIEDIEPFIFMQALASYEGNSLPVYVKGSPLGKDMFNIRKKIVAGKYDLSGKNVVIGKELAFMLGVGVGDKITIISPIGKRTPIGFVPIMKKYNVAGIVNFDYYRYDISYVGMSLENAQKLFNMKNSVTGLQIKLKNPFEAERVKSELEKVINFPYIVRSWQDLNKDLFQALQLEKLAMYFVITLIILVASFNISSLLITKSREKRKEIAILKVMGANNGFILKVFLLQGLIIGFLGTTIGSLIGLTAIYLGDTYHLVKLNPDVYMLEYLPLKITFLDFISVYLSSMVICFISSIIPAYTASKEVPADVLRND